MNIELYDLPDIQRELLCPDKHPQAEAYFDLAYGAILDGNSNLAGEYLSKAVQAIQKGVVLTVLDGEIPLNEDYDCHKRARLNVVR